MCVLPEKRSHSNPFQTAIYISFEVEPQILALFSRALPFPLAYLSTFPPLVPSVHLLLCSGHPGLLSAP